VCEASHRSLSYAPTERLATPLRGSARQPHGRGGAANEVRAVLYSQLLDEGRRQVDELAWHRVRSGNGGIAPNAAVLFLKTAWSDR